MEEGAGAARDVGHQQSLQPPAPWQLAGAVPYKKGHHPRPEDSNATGRLREPRCSPTLLCRRDRPHTWKVCGLNQKGAHRMEMDTIHVLQEMPA